MTIPTARPSLFISAEILARLDSCFDEMAVAKDRILIKEF